MIDISVRARRFPRSTDRMSFSNTTALLGFIAVFRGQEPFCGDLQMGSVVVVMSNDHVFGGRRQAWNQPAEEKGGYHSPSELCGYK